MIESKLFNWFPQRRAGCPFGERRALRTLVICLWAGTAGLAEACAVCMGSPDSPHTKGMSYAILFLLIVTLGVLASFAGFFVYLWRRSKLAATAGGAGSELLQSTRQAGERQPLCTEGELIA